MAAAVAVPEPPAMAYAADHRAHQNRIQGSVLATKASPPAQRSNVLPSPISPAALSPLKMAYPSRSHDSFMSQQSMSDASYPSSPTPLTNSHSQHGSRESRRGSNSGEGRQSKHALGVEGMPRSHASSAKRDLEKQELSRSNGPCRTPVSASTARISRHSYRPEPPPKDMLEQKTLRILLYLSAFSIAITLLALFWALVSLLTILILQPLRLFSKRPPLNQQISDFLAPTLNIQLRFVYSSATAEHYSVPLLLIIHFFSPIVSLGVALAAWTAGVFWIFCLILGNPDGRDRYNDGSNAVLGVRSWWERWLTRAFR